MARLVEAFLHVETPIGELRWLCKGMALNRFISIVRRPFETTWFLPPHLKTWSKDELAELAGRARAWLESDFGIGPEPPADLNQKDKKTLF